MYDNYVKVHLEGITKGVDYDDIYVLLLRDEKNDVLIAILINEAGSEMIERAVKEKDYTPSRLMNVLAGRMGMKMIGIRIMKPHDGKTNALIDFELINNVVSISVPVEEAIVAAQEAKCGMWMSQDCFDLHRNMGQVDGRIRFKTCAMNNDLLQYTLKSAIAADNFELATFIRDELKRREAE